MAVLYVLYAAERHAELPRHADAADSRSPYRPAVIWTIRPWSGVLDLGICVHSTE